MGDIGCNPLLMPNGVPVVGKGAPSQLVIYHQGSLPGALAAVILIPDTESAIVVLSNSLSLNDTPDWVGQLILEEVLEVPERNDYIRAAESSVAEQAWKVVCQHSRRSAEKAKEWHIVEKAVGLRRNVLGQHLRLQNRGDYGGGGFVLGAARPGV